jgi:hypothetical protein
MIIVILIATVVVLPLISLVFFRRGSALPPRQRLAGSLHALLVGMTVPYGLMVDVLKTGVLYLAHVVTIVVAVPAVVIASIAVMGWT